MVRGRRVRTVVAYARNDDCCSPNPKRKDQKILLNGHNFSQTGKTHTITEFFKSVAVDIEDPKPISLLKEHDELNDTPMSVTPLRNRRKGFPTNDLLVTNLNGLNNDPITPVSDKFKMTCIDILSPPTPHRIELCSDIVDENGKKEENNKLVNLQKPLPVPSNTRRKLNNQLINPPESKLIPKDNHKLTEYFPVRRSVRKTKKTVLEEKQRSLEIILRKNIEEGLEVRSFDGKGRGVVAAKDFNKGDFVVEYSGDLIDINEAKKREQNYAQNENTGCYMYYFKHNGIQYCIDATAETGRLGRLVNHSRNGNLTTKIIMVDRLPRLVLVAKDEIKLNEEVTYDYGDRSKESLKYHPWLAY